MNPNPNTLARIHVWLIGRVQGVGYRSFVQQAGVMLELTGWVRNVGYDVVETVAEGPREKLEKFAQAIKNGPRGGRVDEAKVDWEPAKGDFKNFTVKYNL